jgi:sporulation protein YlmC with PRC-barrel domain
MRVPAWILGVVMTVALVPAGAIAADQAQQQGQQGQKPQDQKQEQQKEAQKKEQKTLENPQGEKLGKIKDLMLDPKAGKVAFIVFDANTGVVQGLSSGSDHYLIIPQDHVSYANGKLTVNLSRQQLVQVPGFAANAWPTMDQQYRDRLQSDFRQASGPPAGQPAQSQNLQSAQDQPAASQSTQSAAPATQGKNAMRLGDLVRASQLKGKEVRNRQNDTLGKIEDVVLKLDSGQVLYAVLGSGGVLGIGEKLFAIPLQAFTVPQAGDQIVLTAAKDQVAKAPGFDKDRWPTTANPYWSHAAGG